MFHSCTGMFIRENPDVTSYATCFMGFLTREAMIHRINLTVRCTVKGASEDDFLS